MMITGFSRVAEALQLTTEPVVLIWTDEKPEGALELAPDRWGCIMWLYAKVAKEGRIAVFRRETCGCAGGAVGLGFGRPFGDHSARSEQDFSCFLSNGIEGAEDRALYAATAEVAATPQQKEMLLHGERLMKSPSIVKRFLAALPVYDLESRYVVMKPLSIVEEGEEIQSLTFLADPDQISALSILANYCHGTVMDRVIVAAGAAGCQAMGICTYAEQERAAPRAIIGLTDLMARRGVRRLLGRDILTFSVPYQLYCEMEESVPGSFLEGEGWKELCE